MGLFVIQGNSWYEGNLAIGSRLNFLTEFQWYVYSNDLNGFRGNCFHFTKLKIWIKVVIRYQSFIVKIITKFNEKKNTCTCIINVYNTCIINPNFVLYIYSLISRCNHLIILGYTSCPRRRLHLGGVQSDLDRNQSGPNYDSFIIWRKI